MYIDLPPLPAMFSRMGITRSCAVSIILYLTGCLYINARLPAGESVFHYPIPSVPLISLMILGSYGYLLWHMHKKQPCGRSYFWILATAITFYLLMSTFCYVKAAIPFLHPYALDTFLQRLDIWLHFGIRPYDIIAPHLTPRMIFLLDHLYNEGWLYSMFIYVLWQIFTASSNPGRLHFLSSFLMIWFFIGNGLATLLASVGPTYYSLLYHDQFTAMNQALVDKLYAINASYPLSDAIKNRALLLSWYQDSKHIHANIMSAMPSMHMAVVILMVLHSWRYAKPLQWFTIPFAILMFISSIALGWHYAVDTYVAGVCVYVIWRLNGWEIKHAWLATV